MFFLTFFYFTESPSAFLGNIEINAEVVKTYSCNDHYFILKESSGRPTWSWGGTSGEFKIVWNCNSLYLYCPSTSYSVSASEIKTYDLKVTMDSSAVKVYLDGSYKFECSSYNWSSYYLWAGADDDESNGATFNSMTTS